MMLVRGRGGRGGMAGREMGADIPFAFNMGAGGPEVEGGECLSGCGGVFCPAFFVVSIFWGFLLLRTCTVMV